MSYNPTKLYSDAYSNKFTWEKWLHKDIYQYHYFFRRKYNSPVELQMGVLLPFISSCLGPKTTGLWSTDPGVLNLFWMNIAASGVGKSVARSKFVAQSLEYMASKNFNLQIPDFQVSRYTRAGTFYRQKYCENIFR